MNYEEMSLEKIEFLWNEQIIYMCMGTQDKKIMNALGKEVKRRGEIELLKMFQKDLINCAFRE